MRRGLLFILLPVIAAACASVLGLRGPGEAPFPHRAHVTKGVACTKCHVGMTEAGERGPLHIPSVDSCRECHVDPHDTRDCSQCHGQPSNLVRVQAAKDHLRFEHRAHLPEVAANCARCHIDVAEEQHTLLPPMVACLSCHEHGDTFDKADCDTCHENLETESSRPISHLVHDEDYVDRHATDAAASRAVCSTCHTESECASCHGVNVPALSALLNFDRPSLAGLHRAGFISRHSREASVNPGLCVTCHTENSCQRCHQDRGLAALGGALRNPHPAGWVGIGPSANAHGPAAWRDPASCASCHSGAGEALCVSCHAVGGVGGSIHPPGWTSTQDAVRNAPCRMCHQVQP